VVAFNTISRVADGISYPHSNCDIYGNDIFGTSDDGIEFDYGETNVRCWGNRISNPKNNGISLQMEQMIMQRLGIVKFVFSLMPSKSSRPTPFRSPSIPDTMAKLVPRLFRGKSCTIISVKSK
jgi:hypothetical protein